MKKLSKALLMFVLALSLVACGGDDADETEATEATEVAADETEATEAAEEETEATDGNLSGTVTITGSTSVEKIVMDMKADFEALNPDVKVNYTGTGSSAGIQDAIDGNNDLGAASRELKDEELAEGLEALIFAYDGIAVVVHPSNEVEELSVEDILGIYSGEITNWSEVGGADAGIVVVSREDASGTRGAFEELTGLEDHETGLTGDTTIAEGNGTVQATVAGNENAIGYVSFSFIDETVKDLTVDGGQATAEAVAAGDYPLSRPFQVAYNPDTVTDVTQAFLDYMVTEDAQIFVEDHGGIKVD